MRSTEIKRTESKPERNVCGAKEFFRGLPRETLEAFNAVKLTSHYSKRSKIFTEGQMPVGVFLLREGQTKILMGAGSESERIVRICTDEWLGLSATIAGVPYEVTVEAVTPCRADFIKRADFLKLLRSHEQFCLRIVQLLGQNLHTSYERLRFLLASPSATAKLARVLLDCSEHQGGETSKGFSLHLPLTHREMARMIGVSRETVTRLLGDFKSRRLVKLSGSKMLITNRATLEDIAGADNPIQVE